MPEKSLRFGVMDAAARRRAATWKLWAGQNKQDVYLVCRQIGNGIKLSLHESGRWHFAFGGKELFDEDSVPSSRFLGIYDKAPDLIPGLILACRVHTPWFAVTQDFDPAEEPETVWMSPAPPDHSVEVAIFIYPASGPEPGGWPGRDSMQTNLLGQIELSGGGTIVAVHRVVPFVDLMPKTGGQSRFFKGKSAADLQVPGTRAIGWTQEKADGSIVIMEGPVTVDSESAAPGEHFVCGGKPCL